MNCWHHATMYEHSRLAATLLHTSSHAHTQHSAQDVCCRSMQLMVWQGSRPAAAAAAALTLRVGVLPSLCGLSQVIQAA
jgi:hypothetical protein